MNLVQEPTTMSLEACLDRPQLLPDDADAAGDAPGEKRLEINDCSAPSLVFASESLPNVRSGEVGEGSAFTFTIPLTLGMSDPSNAQASGKRSATVESLLAPAGVRRRVANTL